MGRKGDSVHLRRQARPIKTGERRRIDRHAPIRSGGDSPRSATVALTLLIHSVAADYPRFTISAFPILSLYLPGLT